MKKSARSPENTVLGVSMPKTLKAKIKELADADHRPMAAWAAIHLERIVAEILTREQAAGKNPRQSPTRKKTSLMTSNE